MITETITFQNFNDEPDSRSMHFHITEAVLMEHMTIRDRLANLSEILSGPAERQLSMENIQEIIDLVKWLMSISYGIKSVDGSEFNQDDPAGTGPIWHKFKNSAAYNAFLMSLFKEPEKCVEFILKVLPAKLREQAEAEATPQMQAMLKKSEQVSRPAPGTRIVDDATLAASAPVAPTDAPEEIDYEAMLREDYVAEEPTKDAITQRQADLMKEKLSSTQYEHFMSTRYILGAPQQ